MSVAHYHTRYGKIRTVCPLLGGDVYISDLVNHFQKIIITDGEYPWLKVEQITAADIFRNAVDSHEKDLNKGGIHAIIRTRRHRKRRSYHHIRLCGPSEKCFIKLGCMGRI